MDLQLNAKQSLTLNARMLQSVEILQMSTLELEQHIQQLAQENPVMEMEEAAADPVPDDAELFNRLNWLEDSDYQNVYYTRSADGETDPIALVGTAGGLEETLPRFLKRQIDALSLSSREQAILYLLTDCLDDDGYLRMAAGELAMDTGFSADELNRGIVRLQRLEPAGVAAADLAQCLELQLLRIGEQGPALAIVRSCLEHLARKQYRAIETKLKLSTQQVLEGEHIIRELDPRPGGPFAHTASASYIFPDVFVTEEAGELLVQSRGRAAAPFHVSADYMNMLRHSDQEEVRSYLTAKIRQAEAVLRAVEQRESTLLRCARVIVARQEAFFRQKGQPLCPLTLTEIAQTLEIHESTVSRAMREKYLQCAWGVFPLHHFLSRQLEGEGDAGVSAAAVKAQLRELIQREDKKRPLSDQALTDLLGAKGSHISRRTVAKYREELKLPAASGRKMR